MNKIPKIKLFMLAISLFIIGTVLISCQSDEQNDDELTEENTVEETEGNNETVVTPEVTLTMENGGEILIELYPNIAPNTVNNFISLIEDDFYNGLIFHRVIPDFMIQGGDPNGIGTGGPGYSIKGEFSANDFENNLTHERGVLSMARSQDPDSAGSQFYITVEDSPHLDGDYAAFGRVIEGMDTVDEIVSVERDQRDKPLEDQVIDTMTVDLKGYKPAAVEKQ